MFEEDDDDEEESGPGLGYDGESSSDEEAMEEEALHALEQHLGPDGKLDDLTTGSLAALNELIAETRLNSAKAKTTSGAGGLTQPERRAAPGSDSSHVSSHTKSSEHDSVCSAFTGDTQRPDVLKRGWLHKVWVEGCHAIVASCGPYLMLQIFFFTWPL